jgi:MFS family permease
MIFKENIFLISNNVYVFKAWIGSAFSLGFIFGPLLGALCSQWGIAYWPKSTVSFFILPAIISLVLSLINIAFISQYCPETLPISKRVRLFKI